MTLNYEVARDVFGQKLIEIPVPNYAGSEEGKYLVIERMQSLSDEVYKEFLTLLHTFGATPIRPIHQLDFTPDIVEVCTAAEVCMAAIDAVRKYKKKQG